ncbi:hypothetical protein [Leifsonia poae]|uniref:Uncharacterized protein n=1 Tax=Leifsonia poae TaxID=110933 RepID=A0A9W6LZI5_9MICO|nr:hypothetical protein [Leifsonia poae]GLJ76273.1 hypothetical protein GCM10017584_18470 [Leifsonia poae]
MRDFTTPLHSTTEAPSTRSGPARPPGGLPLTIRFTAPEYAALLRIAGERSTTASHLIEDLVRYALTHSVVPPLTEPPSRARGRAEAQEPHEDTDPQENTA